MNIYVGPDNKHFVLHKRPLTSQSEYFRNAFQGEYKEAKENSIHLEEEDPSAIALLVGWIYKGIIPGTEKKISPFSSSQVPLTTATKVSPPLTSSQGTSFTFVPTSRMDSLYGTQVETFQNLCSQPYYGQYSQEELRLQDYSSGRRYFDSTSTNDDTSMFSLAPVQAPVLPASIPSGIFPTPASTPQAGIPLGGSQPGPTSQAGTSTINVAPTQVPQTSSASIATTNLYSSTGMPLVPGTMFLPSSVQSTSTPASAGVNSSTQSATTSGFGIQTATSTAIHSGGLFGGSVGSAMPSGGLFGSVSGRAPLPNSGGTATPTSQNLFGPVRSAPAQYSGSANNNFFAAGPSNPMHSASNSLFGGQVTTPAQHHQNVLGVEMLGPTGAGHFGGLGSTASTGGGLFGNFGSTASTGGGLFGNSGLFGMPNQTHSAVGAYPISNGNVPLEKRPGDFGYTALIEYPESAGVFIPGIPVSEPLGIQMAEVHHNQLALLHLCLFAEIVQWPVLFNAAIEAYVRGEFNLHRPIPTEHVELIYQRTHSESTMRAYVMESMCTNKSDSLMYIELTREYDELLEDILHKLPTLRDSAHSKPCSQEELIRTFHMLEFESNKGKGAQNIDLASVFPNSNGST